jgi:hypothetical protein
VEIVSTRSRALRRDDGGPKAAATTDIPGDGKSPAEYPTGATPIGDAGDGGEHELRRHDDRRRFCPMGDLEVRQCIDHDGEKTIAHRCPALEQCVAERRALSDRYNAPMSNEFICRHWPGAHLGIVVEGERPRWILQPHRARGCCTPWRTE